MLIKDVNIVYEHSVVKSDIIIEDGVVKEIADGLRYSGKVVDGSGKYLFPKLVDIGTNFSDGSFKTISRVAQKAAKSGVGTVICSSKTTPVLNSETALESFQLKSGLEAIDFKPMIGAKKDAGLSDIAILINKGGVAIEIDSDDDLNCIARAFEYAKLKDVPIICSANSKALQGGAMVAQGGVSNRLGIAGVSTLTETVEVVKIAHMAQYYGVKLLFLHLSCEESIRLSKGCYVSCSIHHLLKDATACSDFNTKAKIYPPLRNKLLKELKNIDIITSMHAKTTTSNKDLAFAQASFGVDCMGEFLSLSYELVRTKQISMQELITKLCYNPAKLFGLDLKIEVAKECDLVLFDPQKSYRVSNSDSLYENETLYGQVVL